ncbi:MAG: hypothetical protein M3P51_14085 [Chloroflexota bacterium]|nr:hypothetical protein [Chloroflexota bacterium]
MMRHLLLSCFLFTCGTMLAPEAAGQYPQGISAQASLGFSFGGGGTFHNREGIALDAVLGFPLQHTPLGTLTGGLSAGAHGPITSDLVCLIGPNNECAPDFPLFLSLGALLGVQRGSATGSTARLLGGPAYFLAQEGGAALGMQGRLEVAAPPFLHVAPVVSLRGALLPSFQGSVLRSVSLGVGLRAQ